MNAEAKPLSSAAKITRSFHELIALAKDRQQARALQAWFDAHVRIVQCNGVVSPFTREPERDRHLVAAEVRNKVAKLLTESVDVDWRRVAGAEQCDAVLAVLGTRGAP